MIKYFLASILLFYSFAGYCQQNLYVYSYKFAPLYKEIRDFKFDNAGLRDEAYNIMLKSISVSCVMYNNGTLSSYDMKDKNKDTADMAVGKVNIDVTLKNDLGKSYGFITNGLAVDFNEKDTTYYYIDSSITFRATGKKRTINKWKCVEYKPDTEIYRCYSLWVCNSLPQSISIFPFKGIKGGVVELDNYNMKMKIYLMSYKKNTNATDYNIHIKTPEKSIDFLANFNK